MRVIVVMVMVMMMVVAMVSILHRSIRLMESLLDIGRGKRPTPARAVDLLSL
jgi:hypothetical protein